MTLLSAFNKPADTDQRKAHQQRKLLLPAEARHPADPDGIRQHGQQDQEDPYNQEDE